MEEIRRDSKVKRNKTELKNTVLGYFQRRNYSLTQPYELSKSQFISKILVESALGRPNSILYSPCNSDPIAIDNNFSRFISWLRDQIQNDCCRDLEQIVGLLFCHLYFDILKGGSADKAVSFYTNHIASVQDYKCPEDVQELLRLLSANIDISREKDQFRSKRNIIELSSDSLHLLKQFVLHSHISFLQVLQTWFDFRLSKEGIEVVDTMNGHIAEETLLKKELPKIPQFGDMLQAIKDLEKEPEPIYHVNICNSKNIVNCGLLKRQCGLVAFSESNVLCLKPLHELDELFKVGDVYEGIRLTNHSGRIYSIAVSPGNTLLSTCSSDNTLCIYDLNEMKLINKCHGHTGPVYCIAFSSSDNYIASGSGDATAMLWHASTGKSLRVFVGHSQAITCITFHPNCLYVATGSVDRNVRLWCVNKGTCLRLLHGARGIIYSIKFESSGKQLVTSSDDCKLRFWDLLNSKTICELNTTKDSHISQLHWSTNSDRLCGGTSDGRICIWNTEGLMDNWENFKYHEPVVVHNINQKVLSIDYSFGTFGVLGTL